MNRHTFALKINDGKKDAFRKALGEYWGDITEILDQNQLTNFSLWNAEDMVFGYFESETESHLGEADQKKIDDMVNEVSEIAEWISKPGEEMRLMYHDFGIVRKNKELIRHRMFMTKLHPGEEEEYKRRHDGLIEKRGDHITEGPDSNFSIWSAKGYIFGYDEIDTTMEKEPTIAETEATVEWENRQLGIMDWITNDVDWITGDVHKACVRLAWHK